MEWRIYYGDGSTYDSSQGPPASASGYNVQAIIQPDRSRPGGNVGTVVLHLHDWYYYRRDSGMWCGGDLTGLLDQLLSRSPIEAVCQGRLIPRNQFDQIIARAMNDPDFPRKSARTHGERP